MSPKFILFGENENLGGGFGGYQVPDPNEFFAIGTKGLQAINVGTEQLYDADGTGDILGGDLRDVQDGYILFSWLAMQMDFVISDPNNFVNVHIREGSTASTVNGGGLVGSQMYLIDFDGDGSVCSTWINSSRPNSPSDSEFGLQANATVNVRTQIYNASLMVVGSQVGGGFTGSTIGPRDNTWAVQNAPTHNFNDQTTGDETIDQTATVTVGSGGTYLYVALARQVPSSGQTSNLRWSYEIDGVPLTNVRTDTATSGAVRTGRGFSCQHTASPSKSNLLVHQAMRVITLPAGGHEFKARLNRHEGDTTPTEQMGRLHGQAFNTNIFSQFYRKERDTVLELSGTTLVTVPEWQIDITLDGTAKVWIGLATDSHGNFGVSARYSIFRDSIELINSGTGTFFDFPSESGDGGADMDNPPTRDSDNNTLPVSIFWYDDPGPGTFRYKVRASSNDPVKDCFGNANDNGEDGFVGTFFVAELKLATTGF